jgi:hypothetical protein
MNKTCCKDLKKKFFFIIHLILNVKLSNFVIFLNEYPIYSAPSSSILFNLDRNKFKN